MPPQLQQLMQNKRMMIIVGAVLAIVLIGVISLVFMGGKKEETTSRKLGEKEMVLATTDNMGRAIEIQALLAREKINLLRKDAEGGKFELSFDDKATTDDRDRAMITLVQSGLMDKNVGLETFEKSDLTASREEKRIKLIRARNGELARLIRKIDPIQDASVFISMPEPTIFKRDMVPISATIQVSLSTGERLNRDKVRSIINLLVGSIEGLDAKHISLTDTNGNVYNSVLDATDELMDRLEERDRYMEQKVRAQLDRLIGANKYVATVSTYLREAPKSQMELQYDPKGSSVSKSSEFEENLNNSSQKNGGMAAGPVSSYVPPEVDVNAAMADKSSRGYNRNGQEVEFNTGKKQVSEDFVPGMLEEISVAVTLDGGTFPSNMTQDEFKTLVARTASPLVNPDNVTVVTGQIEEVAPISPAATSVGSPLENMEIPWWVWAAGSVGLLFFLLLLIGLMTKPSVHPQLIKQQQDEIQQLRELANVQAQQIQMTQQQSSQALEAQQQQLAQLTMQAQQQQAVPQQITQQQQQPQPVAVAVDGDVVPVIPSNDAEDLKQTLAELQAMNQEDESDLDDEALGTEIRSWIEST